MMPGVPDDALAFLSHKGVENADPCKAMPLAAIMLTVIYNSRANSAKIHKSLTKKLACDKERAAGSNADYRGDKADKRERVKVAHSHS